MIRRCPAHQPRCPPTLTPQGSQIQGTARQSLPNRKQLPGKLRELRFYCDGQRVRVSYWIAPGRRIIMLTVFTETRMRETAEIARAEAALARC